MTSDPIDRYLSLQSLRTGRRGRLRILTSPETFDLALQVYRMVGWPMLKTTILPTVFSVAGLQFLFDYVLPGYFWTNQGATADQQVWQAIGLSALGVLVAGPLFLIGISMSTALASSLVSDFMIGNVPDIRAAQGALKRTFPRIALVGLRQTLVSCSGLLVSGALFIAAGFLDKFTREDTALAGIVFLLASIAMVAGFIVLAAVLSVEALSAPVAVLENLGPWAAAKRSRQLLKASYSQQSGFERVWYLYMLLGFITLVFWGAASAFGALVDFQMLATQLGLSGIPAMFFTQVLNVIPVFLILWTVVPIWAVTITIIYYERRVRLEGYDIEALAADVWRADRQNRFEL